MSMQHASVLTAKSAAGFVGGSVVRELIVGPEGGDLVAIVGDRARIVADKSVTGGQCTFFETITAPGIGPPLHSHVHEDEFFYVIAGTVKFSINGNIHIAHAGSFIAAPRGSVHTFVNIGQVPLRMFITVTPSGLEAPFRENAALFKHNPSAGPAEIGEIFAKYGVVFHGPPLDPAA
jgi:quercetin dioxygenase-like cupin family protein